jgi:hypothetical protein
LRNENQNKEGPLRKEKQQLRLGRGYRDVPERGEELMKPVEWRQPDQYA